MATMACSSSAAFTSFNSRKRFCGLFFGRLSFGDVGANRDVLDGFPSSPEIRNDGRIHPVKGAVLGLVFDFALPDPPDADRLPDAADKLLGMKSGIDDAVVLADQFLARIFRNRAELIVHVSDFPLRIRDRHDRVLIDRRL